MNMYIDYRTVYRSLNYFSDSMIVSTYWIWIPVQKILYKVVATGTGTGAWHPYRMDNKYVPLSVMYSTILAGPTAAAYSCL
jgi:hypothetical protein